MYTKNYVNGKNDKKIQNVSFFPALTPNFEKNELSRSLKKEENKTNLKLQQNFPWRGRFP
jgi:hypothetical protein